MGENYRETDPREEKYHRRSLVNRANHWRSPNSGCMASLEDLLHREWKNWMEGLILKNSSQYQYIENTVLDLEKKTGWE